MQLLVGVVIDVHFGTPFQLVHLPFHDLVLVLCRLVIETWVDLIVFIWIQPRILAQQGFNETSNFCDFPSYSLNIGL